jgi:hypothetical protein
MANFDVKPQVRIDGTWTDLPIRHEDGIQIKRGRSDEASQDEPATCSLRVDNRTGDYSPRNPTSPLYGKIGRNTPLRVVDNSTSYSRYLNLPGGYTNDIGGSTSYATTPDDAALDVTGDLDLRIDLDPYTWRPPLGYGLAQKLIMVSPGIDPDLSWRWSLRSDGYLVFTWSPDGLLVTARTAVSTVPIDSTSSRLALRVVLDVDNGAGGATVKFYTDTDINGTYTQLGADVVSGGTSSVYSGPGPLDVGRANVTFEDVRLHAKVYSFQMRSGIGGALVANPVFSDLDTGVTAFTDSPGRLWTLKANAVVVNPNARFHGEVSAWPRVADKTNRDVSTPLDSAGVLRRFGAGLAPLRSVWHRTMTTDPDVVAYWPCEDGEDATQFASGLPGHSPMIPDAETEVTDYTGFKTSEPLQQASGTRWLGKVKPYTSSGQTSVKFLIRVPSGGSGATTAVAARIRGIGSIIMWDVRVTPAGAVQVVAYDRNYTAVHTSAAVGDIKGVGLLMSVNFFQEGSDVRYRVHWINPGSSSIAGSIANTISSRTFGRVTYVEMNGQNQVLTNTTLGQVSVQNRGDGSFPPQVFFDRLAAYQGETAPARFLRLCAEEGIPGWVVGDPLASTNMLGPQLAGTLVDLLREVADSDMGILYEPREFFGLAYRPQQSLYAQEARLALSYSGQELYEFEPTEDDSGVVNDVTVVRTSGSSYRAEKTTGALSVQPPPAGVGRYDDEVTVSLANDQLLADQASWRLARGTVDEMRFPVVSVRLDSASFKSNPTKQVNARLLDVGDRITIGDTPIDISPDVIQQIVQGTTETIDPFTWEISMNLSPASIYDVAVWDDPSGVGEARYSPDGSALAEAIPRNAVSALVLNGASLGRAEAPLHASDAITGDIDIRAYVAMTDWTPSATQEIVTRYVTGGNQRSWRLAVNSTGNLVFIWSTTGVGTLTRTSTVPVGGVDGVPIWVRVTLDVDNGSGGHTVTFYASLDGVNWITIGAPVVTAGVTSIFNGSAPTVVGSYDAGTGAGRLVGRVAAVQVLNGIGGTPALDARFDSLDPGTVAFVDAAGRGWDIVSPSTIGSMPAGLFPSVFSVATPVGPVWTSADGQYDIRVGGERMTVVSVTGSSSPQLFSVKRAVNGVKKAHAAGSAVELFKPAIYAL